MLKEKTTITKNKKFRHKWTFDPNLAYCKEIGIWCLRYLDGKGIF